MENQEEIHDVLTLFEKKPSADIPQVLEDYLQSVAKTGKTLFPWNKVKTLFITKVEQVMDQFNKDVPYDHLPPFPNVENTKYVEIQKRIVEAMHRFSGAPFTVQRICELVTQPRKHYTRCDKFLRGIEKNVMVVSTVDPFGRKIVSESPRLMVNGLDSNGFSQKSDFNDFTEGQPFGQMVQPNWSNNNTATIWPAAGMLDSEEPLQKNSASIPVENMDPNINAANPPHALATGSSAVTDSEKFSDTSVPLNNSEDSTGFSTLFQDRASDNEHLECPPEHSSLSEAQGAEEVDPKRDGNVTHDGASNTRAVCEGQLEDEAGADGEQETPVVTGLGEESSSQAAHGPPDSLDNTDTDSGPPQKKLRVETESADQSIAEEEDNIPEATSSEGTTPEITTPETSSPEGTTPEENSLEDNAPEDNSPEDNSPEDNSPETSSSESQQQSRVDEPQSSSESEPITLGTSTESDNSCSSVQEENDNEVTQSDLKPLDDSNNMEEQVRASEDDQSLVTSTEDGKQAGSRDSSAESEQVDNSADSGSGVSNEPESAVENSALENQIEDESSEIENEVSTNPDVVNNDAVPVSESREIIEEADCSSTAEMMETDSAEEEKQESETLITTGETEEEMEQD